MLSGRRYNSIKPLGSAVCQWLNSIPRADYFAAFWSWISRLEKYISVKENEMKILIIFCLCIIL